MSKCFHRSDHADDEMSKTRAVTVCDLIPLPVL